MPTPITAESLKDVGFKWCAVSNGAHEFRHWILWIGYLVGGSYEDLGIEVAPKSETSDEEWFCWLRADYAGRYSRFIHVRHLRSIEDIAEVFAGLTGLAWDSANHLYGIAHRAEEADRLRLEADRLDRRIMRQHQDSPTAWSSDVADPNAARAMVGWRPPTKEEAHP